MHDMEPLAATNLMCGTRGTKLGIKMPHLPRATLRSLGISRQITKKHPADTLGGHAATHVPGRPHATAGVHWEVSESVCRESEPYVKWYIYIRHVKFAPAHITSHCGAGAGEKV